MPAPELAVDQQGALHAVLKQYEGQHVHFFPKLGNCGDGFIAYATYKMFEAYNISFTTHRQDAVLRDCIIFIGGGGNLIEGLYCHVADTIRANCQNNKIVLLPHTIAGYKDIVQETHKDLSILCRDRPSYEGALSNGANEKNLHISDDMAFCFRNGYFDSFLRESSGVLFALREDAESTRTIELPVDNIDISRSWDGDIWTSPLFAEYASKSLFAFVSQFDAVVTDRLHVSIVGSLLRKRVLLMPNSYFKNIAVYKHSMQHRFPHTVLHGSPEGEDLMRCYGITLTPSAPDGSDLHAREAGECRQHGREHSKIAIKSILAKFFGA